MASKPQIEEKTEPKAVVTVEISFFKPEGFSDTHYVAGDHRGNALKTVLALYDDDHLRFLNYITCRTSDRQKHMKVIEDGGSS